MPNTVFRLPSRPVASGSAIMLILVALAAPARADSIDGRWCSEDGRRMDIQGSTIVTPNGTTMIGNYGRHDFSYTVPPQEPLAGTAITMRLRGETTINLWKGASGGEPEVWKRCTPVS